MTSDFLRVLLFPPPIKLINFHVVVSKKHIRSPNIKILELRNKTKPKTNAGTIRTPKNKGMKSVSLSK